MSSTPRVIGTLIVVVLKANHLPNKRHIGKQDPYCLVIVNGEKRRTKAIKRGGQHPEWDEEIRFTLYEDVDDILQRTANGDSTPPAPPPKDDKKSRKIKGGKTMKLACYADDPREPDMIGEADVDLTEVLTKGETDEWFTLTNKDKFAGKVYLELTFWSNEAPPEKKSTIKPKSKQYGGPGSFVPLGDLPSTAPGIATTTSRVASAGHPYDYSRQNLDTIPSSLRASTSLAMLDLYVAPYEQRSRLSQVDRLTNNFNEFGIAERRRESFPPVHGGAPYLHTFNDQPPNSINPYDHNIPESTLQYVYDQSPNPTNQSYVNHTHSMSVSQSGYTAHHAYQQPQYDQGSPMYHHPTGRGPRHSIPTSSSGFMPISNQPNFVALPSHPTDPNFASAVSHTPAPLNYGTNQYSQPYAVPPQTPVTANSPSYLPNPTPVPYQHPQSFPPSQSFGYSQYPPGSQQYVGPEPAANTQQQPHPSSPQVYQNYSTTPSPSHDSVHAVLPNGTGSRPLPQQPQIVYSQQNPQGQPSTASPQSALNYSPTQNSNSSFPTTYSPVPPPPPPPPSSIQYSTSQPLYPSESQPLTTNLPPPPPPPQLTVPKTRRNTSLPQPPIQYQPVPPVTHPLPPPPPPPSDYFIHSQQPPPPPPLSSNQTQTYHPGPPPKPPAQVEGQEQWLQPQQMHSNQLDHGYA